MTWEIKSLSVHYTCNVGAQDPQVSLLFSRYGLEDLMGVRGSLFSMLGIHEATNFQSNLDNLAMDIRQELLDVLVCPSQVTVLQLYVDSPHVLLQMPHVL